MKKIEYYNFSSDGIITTINNDSSAKVESTNRNSTTEISQVEERLQTKRKETTVNDLSTESVTPDVSQKKLRTSKLLHIDSLQDSMLDHPVPYQSIKDMNRLFFSYDPRGIKFDEKLPQKYCPDCRCPSQYCSNIVMAKEVEEHVRFLVNDDRSCRCGHPLTYMSLECTVKKAYSHQVNHRMLNNGIKYVEGFNPYQGHTIPKCMTNTQEMIIAQILKEEKTIAEGLHKTYIENRQAYYTPTAKREETNDNDKEEDDDLPDLKRRDSSEDEDENGEEDNQRTSVEQKADLGPMFKMIKMEIEKRNRNN